MALFVASYLLNDDGPYFSPNFEIDNDSSFFGLMNSLLEDIVKMGLYMERIADNYPPYCVKFYLFYFYIK